MDTKGNILAAFSFIAIALLLPAFVWHCRCKNVPAIFLICWLQISNIISFINAIAWSDENFYEKWDGKVYCDIAVKLDIGASCGKVAAISVLAMNLYMVLCANNPIFMGNKSKKKLIIELSMCAITPIFVMSVNYIIQSGRYSVLRYTGCVEPYSESVASLFLSTFWTFLWAIVAVVFAVLLLRKYFQKRKDVKDILRCTNSGLNAKRFARLLIFSLLIVLVLAPLTTYYFVADALSFKGKFSWKETHNEYWDFIYFFDVGYSVTYGNFINIGLSIITFILFGLGSDALDLYKSMFRKLGFNFGSKKDDNQLFKISSNKSDQTRVNSNRSKASGKLENSALTNGSHMTEFESEFKNLVKENFELPSPDSSLGKNSATRISTVDLEKGSSNEVSFNSTESPRSQESLYVLNQEQTPSDDGFHYGFRVVQNNT
ncbi:uncharacterized protein PRCAT00005122001 [Priceomyces carsonii]|uniref:uncharacterized protein n=1 Tax=Priceomyces carsonii TaxID=28549 RepID=UPI002ED85F6F|nr:unnamed protein product [Priceomyces carsonii]